MADLIDCKFVSDRLAVEFTPAQQTQVEAFIADASGIIRDVGVSDWDRLDTDNLPPAAVKAVCYQMVRRAYLYPDGFKSEQIGDYRYTRDDQTGPSPGVDMTPAEYRTVRRAAGLANVTTVGLRRPNAYERQWVSSSLAEDDLVL